MFAVGDYVSTSGVEHGLLEVLSGGSWSSVEAPLPSNGDDTHDASLATVSCASTSWCVAVGRYSDMSGGTEGLVETYSGGHWTASQAPVPTDGVSRDDWFVKTVSCPGVNDCTAVGGYKNAARAWG